MAAASQASDPVDASLHIPVLGETVLGYFEKCELIIDGTVGTGGHSEILLASLPNARVIAFDVDDYALAVASSRLAPWGSRIEFYRQNFREIPDFCEEHDLTVDGILLDLGVSLGQLSSAERGFSYWLDGPLDMRMDGRRSRTAADLVNQEEASELERIFWEFGEERWAKRLAHALVGRREQELITRTSQLVAIIEQVIPLSKKRHTHRARKVFQALRIAVNEELKGLKEAIQTSADYLNPGGRFVVISYHSLEDREVKEAFRYLSLSCICPPDFPVCRCEKKSTVKLLARKPVVPSEEEVQRNTSSRSAKLRAAEHI